MANHIEPAEVPAISFAGQRLHIEYWPIAKLKDYERNPRKNDGVVERMVASITAYGFAIPVLARSTGEVVDGHLRLKAARKLGMTEVPVIPCDGWTDAQVKAFRLMVNRSVSWADWDLELLAAEFGDLQALDFDLTLTAATLMYLMPTQKATVSCTRGAAPASQRRRLLSYFEESLGCKASFCGEVGHLFQNGLVAPVVSFAAADSTSDPPPKYALLVERPDGSEETSYITMTSQPAACA